MSGPADLPQISASLASVSVGSVYVGKSSTPVTVAITNIGKAAGVVTTMATGAGIVVTGCSGNLAAGMSCALAIAAAPNAAGPIAGSVTVSISGGNTVTIAVSGTAVLGGAFVLDKSAIDFGDIAVGQQVQATVTVTATAGLSDLVVDRSGADITFDPTSTCASTLVSGASCTVVVDFTSAKPGAATGDAVVVSQGGVSKSVAVHANVLTLAKLAASPTSVALAAAPGVSSAPATVNVGNTGGMATGQIVVAIAGTSSADFKIGSDTCSIVTLSASSTCAITVSYSPVTATAAATAKLTITDKGPGASVATVALTGTPMSPLTLTITGGPSLGSVAPGGTGAEVLFTVTNTSVTPSGALTLGVNNPSITISSNTCAAKANLSKDETCTVGLTLTPLASATPAAIAALLTVSGTGGSASTSVIGAIL
jgi:hypothetical protein